MESSEAVEEALETPDGEDPEQVTGLVYVLGTGVFTKEGKRIVKIGYTTQDIATRIRQLYTTGAMFQFEELASYRVDNYDLLEQALHKLLAPFRLNNAREFFRKMRCRSSVRLPKFTSVSRPHPARGGGRRKAASAAQHGKREQLKRVRIR